MTLNKNNKLTLFYDGQCPLCKAEILFLESRNKNHLLEFIDVSAISYSEKDHEISCNAALEKMHGRFSDGKIITGISVFAAAYERADLKLLAWIFSRKWMQPFLGIAYQIFVKYRHQISKTIGPSLLKITQNRLNK